MSNGGRRAELDGVRGIAILLVLVGHADSRLVPLAAAGVALFFTLSGYLITGLLLAERGRHGRLNLRRFYARRMTRLAPPLFVMLAVMGAALGSGWQLVGPATWTANYAVVLGVDTGAFGHTWSLAVEEQFYLVWPVALVFLLRRRNPARTLRHVMMALVAWWALVVLSGNLEYAYRALETAGVPILGGCLVALGGGRVLRGSAVPLVGLLCVSGLLAVIDAPRSWALVPVLCTPLSVALVASANRSPWLAWRPLAFCGVASYSVYLWHYPMAWLVGGGEVTPLGVVAGAAAGLVAYFAVEVPLMRWREGRRPAPSEVPESTRAVLLRA